MGILTNVKHITGEVDGVRCSVVESGISRERVDFLAGILRYNGYEVKIQQDKTAEDSTATTYTIGVTDILFNAIYKIYERLLRRPDGEVVTPAYWRQESGDTTGWYWTFGKTMEPDYYE